MAITDFAVTSASVADGLLTMSGTYSWSANNHNDFIAYVTINGNLIELGSLTDLGAGNAGTSTWTFTVAAPVGMTPGVPYTFTVVTGTGTTFTTSEFEVACFYPGTLITTAAGEKVVEELQVGDLIATADGRLLPVRWIGRQVVSRQFTDELRALPIRIKAGAIAENVPRRDLLVTPGHAMFVAGVLANAGALVNGTTIVRERDVPEVVTYYHVEFEEHALLLAEGAPSESYIDLSDRRSFTNWQEHEVLHGRAEPIPEMPYPRAKSHRQVPAAVRRQIEDRAAALMPAAEAS